ncbi:UNVERIFIED_CONTAM: Nuclear import receptor, partial [Siphonaria sp. JEL0065]
KSSEAWGIAQKVLLSDRVCSEATLFSASTLRQKLRYDAGQLTAEELVVLRDVVVGLLLRGTLGQRPATRQLAGAVASLAVLVRTWSDPVADLFDLFSTRDREHWRVLVEIVAALPYEFAASTTDSSFFLGQNDVSDREKLVVDANATKVLLALSQMLDQPNSTLNEQEAEGILDAVRAWLIDANVNLSEVHSTGIVQKCFALLLDSNTDDAVFDAAVDVLTEVVRRTGRVLSGSSSSGSGKKRDDNKDSPGVVQLVQLINEGLLAQANGLKVAIQSQDLDQGAEDRCRAFTRLFCFAGESFLDLILRSNNASWFPIAEAILLCTSAVKDLEIVAITFQFWIILADEVEVKVLNGNTMNGGVSSPTAVYSPWLEIFVKLFDAMVVHLHYPVDEVSWSAKERDEFREFRHNMGDVLKACILVLGQNESLLRPYRILQSFLLPTAPGGTLNANIPWQQIEAPLFALRTIGRKISDDENTVLPLIMGMLPQLPQHLKVKYAAILLIGTYSSWTKLHPEFLAYQMTFIAKGFEEREAIGAASQSLRFLCDECGDQLVGYLGQLHPFYLQIVKVLDRVEKADVITALANVIRHVPLESTGDSPNMLKVLEMFCLPIAQRLHVIGAMPSAPEGGYGEELQKEVSDLVEQFTSFIYNAQPNPSTTSPTIQHPCTVLFKGMWPVLESLLSLRDAKIINSVCKLIVKCVDAQRVHFKPLANTILPTLATFYESTQVTSLMWAASKCIKECGSDTSEEGAVVHLVVQRMSQTAFRKIQEAGGKMDHVSDVIEDYFILLTSFLLTCPAHFAQSPLLPTFLECAVACMPVVQFDAWLALYADFFKQFLSLSSPIQRSMHPLQRSLPPQITDTLQSAITLQSSQFMANFLTGITRTFPYREDITYEEGSHSVVVGTIVICLCDALGGVGNGLNVIGQGVTGMYDPKFGEVERGEFAGKLTELSVGLSFVLLGGIQTKTMLTSTVQPILPFLLLNAEISTSSFDNKSPAGWGVKFSYHPMLVPHLSALSSTTTTKTTTKPTLEGLFFNLVKLVSSNGQDTWIGSAKTLGINRSTWLFVKSCAFAEQRSHLIVNLLKRSAFWDREGECLKLDEFLVGLAVQPPPTQPNDERALESDWAKRTNESPALSSCSQPPLQPSTQTLKRGRKSVSFVVEDDDAEFSPTSCTLPTTVKKRSGSNIPKEPAKSLSATQPKATTLYPPRAIRSKTSIMIPCLSPTDLTYLAQTRELREPFLHNTHVPIPGIPPLPPGMNLKRACIKIENFSGIQRGIEALIRQRNVFHGLGEGVWVCNNDLDCDHSRVLTARDITIRFLANVVEFSVGENVRKQLVGARWFAAGADPFLFAACVNEGSG